MSPERSLDPLISPIPASVPIVRRPSVDLHSGDAMPREQFHRLYEQSPADFKAELIEGIVYVASPLKLAHGEPHALLGAALVAYARGTPGVRASDNTTIILGDDAEPQPDLILRILPDYGGQAVPSSEGYLRGAPELIVEIAHSSQSIDLHAKKEMYARYGGREYVVACVKEKELRWFDLLAGRELSLDEAGVARIAQFAGLWINGPALFAHDAAQLMATLEEGLATAEHTAFVNQLAAQRRG